MKYLIICSYFPPDSAISAVRPYMFAKYLSRLGNSVTVLRSGAFNSTPDESYEILENVKVISFLGKQSDAELYNIGLYKKNLPKRKIHFKGGAVRDTVRTLYYYIREPLYASKRLNKARSYFSLQKKVIDSIDSTFDIVISTYSELENIFAGEYAAKHFNAKWIMDFRDSVVDHIHHERYVWNVFAKQIQINTCKKADLCIAVSNGLSSELKRLESTAAIETIYNGYDEEESVVVSAKASPKLTICYTGQIYGLRLAALKHLVIAIKQLVSSNIVDNKQISFVYAGGNSETVTRLFAEHSLQEILNDNGQVSRTEALKLQNMADIFLVLSWNTRTAKGILTGKFYEGVRAKKPILAIVEGDVPGSELMYLNQQYQYGFCYESSDRKSKDSDISEYISLLCKEKESTGIISYKPSPLLEEKFKYRTIVKQLSERAQYLCEK